MIAGRTKVYGGPHLACRPWFGVSWFVDYAGLLVIQSAICLADLNIDPKALQRCW